MSKRDHKELYRLIYKVDGKVCLAEWYAKGESLKSVAVPSKGTFEFSGWSNLPDKMPDHDVVIEGTFTPASHDLVYMLEGAEFARRRFAFGSPTESPEVPERQGATFAGWEGLPETMPDEDVTVNGRYENNSYRLTYVVNDRHSFTVMTPYESAIEPMDYPKKDHYTFSGWEGLPETMPDHDVTVEGRLEMKTFRLVRIVDGEVFMDEQLRIGDKINKKAKPVKPGYYFSGWRNLPDTMPDHDITAITSMYPARFRVDYEIDGEAWRTSYLPYESKFEPEIPTDLEGKKFLGWIDAPETIPMHDFTVHGSTVPAEEEPAPAAEPEISTYTLTFVVDGEVVQRRILEEGAAIELPEQEAKEGYSFAWENAAETMPAGDLTVNGAYTLNLYRLVFKVDGEEISSETLPFGASITVPTPEIKPGQTVEQRDPRDHAFFRPDGGGRLRHGFLQLHLRLRGRDRRGGIRSLRFGSDRSRDARTRRREVRVGRDPGDYARTGRQDRGSLRHDELYRFFPRGGERPLRVRGRGGRSDSRARSARKDRLPLLRMGEAPRRYAGGGSGLRRYLYHQRLPAHDHRGRRDALRRIGRV